MFVVERLISVVAPHECLVCGGEGQLLCNWCALEAFVPVPSRCYLCRSATDNSKTCKKCRAKSRLKHVWLVTEYDELAKKLIKTFKFERAQAAAPILAAYMKATLPHLENYIIIPVPPATSRLRLRGYDHARLIAKELARLTGLEQRASLARLGQSRQVGARRQERVKQLEGAFRLKNETSIRGAKILLLDDVLTTGTTLNEAAKVLRKAGAKEVSAVVFAQTH